MKLSKSKLALAKVINESGGWPDEGNYVVQQDDLGLYASTGKPIWMKKSGRFSIEYCAFICDAKKITNRHQAVLSREEYYQDYPKVDADGWIEWKGGDCPIGSGSLIDVKYRDGHLQVGCRAGSRCDTELYATTHWGNSGGAADIIAYRLHKPEVKPEFCESVMRSIPELEVEDAQSRLDDALAIVRTAAPHLLSDKYKFEGDEVMGERKPTIEQLAQDYRNKLDYANRKQLEAEDARAVADAALGVLELAWKEIGFMISPIVFGSNQDINITNLCDLELGDVIKVTGFDGYAIESNRCDELLNSDSCTVVSVLPVEIEVSSKAKGCNSGWRVDGAVKTKWKFIGRP